MTIFEACASKRMRLIALKAINPEVNPIPIERNLQSMPIPFPENSECESAQFKGKREGAHLVQNPTAFHIPAQAGFVLLAAEPTEDIHHGAFAGFVKGAQGNVLGLGEQGFGFSHFSSLMDVSK